MSTSENFADANRARVAFIKEIEFGTTPTSPVMQTLRTTASDLSVTKETSPSDEIRADRQVADVTALSFSSGGSASIEWSMLTYDQFLAAALGTDWINGGNISTNISWTVSGSTVTITGTLSGLTVTAGQLVHVSAGTVQDFFKVISFSGSTLVIADGGGAFGTNGSASGILSAYNSLNGIEKFSFSIEQAYIDASAYQLFRGQRVSTFSLSIESAARVTGSFGFMGLEEVHGVTPYGTSYLPATDTPTINATSNVATVLVDGVVLTVCIQSIALEIENSLREQRGVGSSYPCGIGYGRQLITGTLTAYFADFDLYNKFINHEDISLLIPLFDSEGNGVAFEMPKVKLNTDPIAPTGIDTDIIQEIEFQAIYDPEDGATIRAARHDNTSYNVAVLAGGDVDILASDNEE